MIKFIILLTAFSFGLNDMIEKFSSHLESCSLTNSQKEIETYNGCEELVLEENVDVAQFLKRNNTRFIIKKNYNLNGLEITIGEHSILDFQGGIISNGTLKGQSTIISSLPVQIFGENISLKGSWTVPEAYIEWFPNNSYIELALKVFGTIKLLSKEYLFDAPIYMPAFSEIIGKGFSKMSFRLPKGPACIYIGYRCSVRNVDLHTYSDNSMLNFTAEQIWRSFDGTIKRPEERPNGPWSIDDVTISAYYKLTWKDNGEKNPQLTTNAIEFLVEGNDYVNAYAYYLTIRNVNITGAWRYGIYLNQVAKNKKSKFRAGWFTNITFSNVNLNQPRTGIYLNGGDEIVTDKIYFDNVSFQATEGFTERFAHIVKCRNAIFSNCWLWDWDNKILKSPFLVNSSYANNILFVGPEISPLYTRLFDEEILGDRRNPSFRFNIIPMASGLSGMTAYLANVISKGENNKYKIHDLFYLAPGFYSVSSSDLKSLAAPQVSGKFENSYLEVKILHNSDRMLNLVVITSASESLPPSYKSYLLYLSHTNSNTSDEIKEILWARGN